MPASVATKLATTGTSQQGRIRKCSSNRIPLNKPRRILESHTARHIADQRQGKEAIPQNESFVKSWVPHFIPQPHTNVYGNGSVKITKSRHILTSVDIRIFLYSVLLNPFLPRDVIYTSRAYMLRCQCPSVCL